MALVKNILTIEMEKFMDQESPNFVTFPSDVEQTAEVWSFAINEYAQNVFPLSVTSDTAREAFRTQMLILDNSIGNGDIVFKAAFTQYATVLAAGMQPNFTGAAPSSPIEFAPVYILGLGGASNKICMDAMINIIDAWFKTGTAKNNNTGVTVTWS